MWTEDYQWHYDYVRLAWDTGFAFDKCKSPNLDKNKICIVDVDKIVQERDVSTVDRYISTVIQYILEDKQAKVLDTNFVKTFRMSQLAVEYLLFCKKYLDNTVVLLKKELNKNREENKELNILIHDLQSHIESLTRQQSTATFKCNVCAKVFATEEYLNAHKRRRHDNINSESYTKETDKLNMEIKELKQRLNNTEKLLKEKEEQIPEKSININESHLTDVLKTFDNFKNQVEDELKELRLQKSFYEENYGKLFNMVIQNKENLGSSNVSKEVSKIENTTQTDKILKLENVNNRNVIDIKDSNSSSIHEDEQQMKANVQIQKETVEARITTTLAGIEGQMQAFWDKLNEIEQNGKAALCPVLTEIVSADNITHDEIQEVKPRAKPRSKLSHPTLLSKIPDNKEKLKGAIKALEEQKKMEQAIEPESIVIVQEMGKSIVTKDAIKCPTNQVVELVSSSSSESLQSDTISDKTVDNVESVDDESKSSESNISITHEEEINVDKKRQSTTSSKELKSRNQKSVLKEIEETISYRLQNLGISGSWIRLPSRSFEKALDIIKHQASLTVKTYPNFHSIRNTLSEEIDNQIKNQVGVEVLPEKKINEPKNNALKNIVRISHRVKTGKKYDARSVDKSLRGKTIEINRAIFETDSDSESITRKPNKQKLNDRDYSNVINELKSLPNHKIQTDQDSMDDINRDAQKGVLKSYPSVGSLSKKKVLFNLETDKRIVQPKAGGSTTSVASSILGEKIAVDNESLVDKEKLKSKDNEKDLDYMSDFELSDLE